MAQQQKEPAKHWRHVHKRLNEHMLFAEDLGPVGTRVDVEVIDSGVFAVKGEDGSKDMPWLAFRGADGKPRKKKLGLNVSNCKSMEMLCGTADYTHWRGWVTLVVVRTKFYDTKLKAMAETDAIRIATERPRRQASAPPAKDEPAFDPDDIQPEDR
jgi:hypothetical protein